MAIFRKRADPEIEKEDELSPEMSSQLLRAFLSPEIMDREKALNIPSIYGCVDKIASKVASTPVKLYRMKDGKKEEILDDRRVFLLNEETGDTLDGNQFKKAMTMDYLLGKGGYAYVNWENNIVKSIHYVEDRNISFSGNSDVIFKRYYILVQGNIYDPSEFIRFIRNTKDGRSGSDITSEAQKILNVSYNSLKYEEYLVASGGNKKGFIKSLKRLTEDKIEKLKEAWRNLYSTNSENVIILNDGLDFKEASNTSVEMQLNENKKANANENCKLFGIPHSILDGGATEQDEKIFIKYKLNDVFSDFERAINRAMLLESEKGTYFFAFDQNDLTKGDIEKRYAAYGVGLEKGFLQPDEVRFKENMPPLDLDFVKLGLQDVIYFPNEKSIYTPNTNSYVKIGDGIQCESKSEGTQQSLTGTSTQLEGTAGQSETGTESDS